MEYKFDLVFSFTSRIRSSKYKIRDKNMKVATLLSVNAALAYQTTVHVEQNPVMNMLLMESLMGDSEGDTSDMLMMMMMSPGLLGQNPAQAGQMSSMLPLLLMDSESDDNTNMLMMTMMMNPNADMSSVLPLLMMDDGTTDMKSLFLMTTMMQANCGDTNQQMNSLLPLLLMGDGDDSTGQTTATATDDSSDSSLKTILLMQTMSQGNKGLDMNAMLPFLLMDDESDDDHLMKMVLMSSMMGGMDNQVGFANNFNMLLPMLMTEEGEAGESDMDMLVLLTAMQSQAPGSALGATSMLPLLLMDSSSNNQELLMFMSMMSNQQC